MEKPVSKSNQGHRDACDECHQRKVRCIAANGACRNCVSAGATCSYSPKIPAGRPKKKRDAPSKTSEPGSKTNAKDHNRSASSVEAAGRPNSASPRHQIAAAPKDIHNGTKSFGPTATIRHGQLTPDESIEQEGFPLMDSGVDDMMNAFDSATFCSNLEQDSLGLNFDQDPSFWAWDQSNQNMSSLDGSLNNFSSHGSFAGHGMAQNVSRPQAPAFRRNSSRVNPVLFQRTISGLMDLVMTLRSTSMGLATQLSNGSDIWLRDDNAVFTSLNHLCDVTEEVVDALNGYESLTLFSILSQVQMCFYLTHKACVLIADNLQSHMMNIKSRYFRQTIPQGNNVNGRHHPSRSLSWPTATAAQFVQLSQAFPLAMTDRLQNTVHMTGARFQVARLLALLESVIELIVRSEENGISLSMVSVDEMRTNGTHMRCLIHDMQTVVDALKSSDQYGSR